MPRWMLLGFLAGVGLRLAVPAVASADPAARRAPRLRAQRPPPLRLETASYGVGLTADVLVHPGASCSVATPCILGGGGGLALRGGFRWPGPWYLGGAYQISRTDSSNLYRLATLQQLRVEMRYMLDVGYRTVPFASWGAGAVAYGNEFGAETAGATAFAGLGVEVELSRVAVLGFGARYQPMLLAGFVDTAGYDRPLGVAHYGGLELQFEIRREVFGR